MHVEFVCPGWNRPRDDHPELRAIEAHEYIGTPAMGAASLAAVTPEHWTYSFHDDRVTRVEPAKGPDLVAIPIFTPAADRAMEIADGYRELGVPVVAGGIFSSLMPEVVLEHVDAVCIGEGEAAWPTMLADFEAGTLDRVYRSMSKDATAADIAKAVDTVKTIQDHGLEVYASFSVGHDTQDRSVFDRVMQICSDGDVQVAEFAMATPYPGTRAWRRLGKEGRLLGRPWQEFNDANVVFQPNHMTPDELTRVYLDLWREYHRSRPANEWPIQI